MSLEREAKVRPSISEREVRMSSIAPALAFRLKSIWVATDLSETSEKSLQHALAIARHYGGKLYLVNVVSSLGFTH